MNIGRIVRGVSSFGPTTACTHSSPHLLALQGVADLEREEEDEMEDSGEVLDDSSSSPSSTLKNYPLTCKVLYSYKVRGASPLLQRWSQHPETGNSGSSTQTETGPNWTQLDPDITGSDLGFPA